MIALELSPRSEPLVASAVLAFEQAAIGVVSRLLSLDESRLARLHGVCGDRFVLVLGAEADLPWAEGVTYLGRDEGAPQLLLPTALAPNVPSTLLERALARHIERAAPRSAAPWAVNFSPAFVISIAAARPLTRGALEKWPKNSAVSTAP